MGKIKLTDNFQGDLCQIKAKSDFEYIEVKKGELGGYVNYYLMVSEPLNLVSWLDKKSIFFGGVMYEENVLENSIIDTYFIKNSKFKNCKVKGFHAILNCEMEDMELNISPSIIIKNGKIRKKEELKVLELENEHFILSYPHLKTREIMVFLGNIEKNIFEPIEIFKEKMQTDELDYSLVSKEFIEKNREKIMGFLCNERGE